MLQLVYFVSVFCVHGVYGAFSRVWAFTRFLEHLDLVFLLSRSFFFLVWRHVDTIHAEAREDPVLSSKP